MGQAGWNSNLFRPPWASAIPGTSGRGGDPSTGTFPPGTTLVHAWGPWTRLNSCEAIAINFQKAFGKIGRWRAEKWNSGGFYFKEHAKEKNDATVDVIGSFTTGQNPFNDYEIGLFTGHGVSAKAGSYTDAAGNTVNLPAQHYMPILANPRAGVAHWIQSANMPKYGAAGSKLNWMFLYTCNSLTDTGPYAIYDEMKAAGTLPFGPSLHTLCGYATKIDVEPKMGALLVNSLLSGGETPTTVIAAWRYVWANSLNSKPQNNDNTPKAIRRAKVVYWPECVNDTIYGVRNQNVTDPTGPFDQNRLLSQDITTP